MRSVNIGIIGYRGFAAFCAEALRESDAAHVIAFAGRDRAAMEKSARQFGITRAYTDYRDLIADPMVELVHISTPPDQHAAMAVAAIGAGKHVFVEKPLATDKAGADAVLDALRRATGIVGGINYVMRYNPLYENVRRIAEAGLLGALTHVSFQNYASDEGLGDDHWFWDADASGGIFVEHGVHFFDIVGSIVNAPATSVAGQTWRRNGPSPACPGHEDRVLASVSYANGVAATFYHAFNRPGILERQAAHFAFERGHVLLHGWTPNRLSLDAIVDQAGYRALTDLLPDALFSMDSVSPVRGGGRTHDVDLHLTADIDLGDPTPLYRAAVRAAFEDVAAAITSPGLHSPRVTIKNSLPSLQIALAARQSAVCGVPISL